MKPLSRPSPVWFASLVALLVALGTQTLLESVVPSSITDLQFGWPDPTIIHHAGGSSYWIADSVIRLLSFALGGFVGCFLVGSLSSRLLAGLLVVAVLDTVFEQLPGPGPILWWVLWSLVAPAGILLGGWAANVKRAA